MKLNITQESVKNIEELRTIYNIVDVSIIVFTILGCAICIMAIPLIIIELYILQDKRISFGRILFLGLCNEKCRQAIDEITYFHAQMERLYVRSENIISHEAQRKQNAYEDLLKTLQDLALTRRRFFKTKGWWVHYLTSEKDPFIDPILSIAYKEEDISKWRSEHPKRTTLRTNDRQ